MNLKEFVTDTLTQIIAGVEDAKNSAGSARVNPTPRKDTKIKDLVEGGFILSEATELVQQVEFDVAVTVVDAKGSKGGIGVFVAGAGLGAQGKSEQTNTALSRIKFKVPVSLP